MKTSGGKEFHPGWRMTVDQARSYWRLWKSVTVAMGWSHLDKAELDSRRHDQHEAAGLGRCSVKAIDYLKGYDAIKGRFLALLRPADANAQLRQINMNRTRLLRKITIEQVALLAEVLAHGHQAETETSNIEHRTSNVERPNALERSLAAEHYILKIIGDKFGRAGGIEQPSNEGTKNFKPETSNLELLKDEDLEHLRSTLARCISELRQKAGLTVHALHQKAMLPCPRDCAECARNSKGKMQNEKLAEVAA